MYKHLSCVAFKIKLTTGSGNAGTREKLYDRSRMHTYLYLLVPDDCFKYPSLYETYTVLTSECQNYNSLFSFLLKLSIFSNE